jgi:hypothetical protein
MTLPSRRTLAAVFALTAWVNVQAMTCCGVSIGKAERAEAADEHACCPGSAKQGSSEQASSHASSGAAQASHEGSREGDCGMSRDGGAALCCGVPEPALSSFSAVDFQTFESSHPIASAIAVVPEATGIHLQALSRPVASAGPPRYLSLHRFLI